MDSVQTRIVVKSKTNRQPRNIVQSWNITQPKIVVKLRYAAEGGQRVILRLMAVSRKKHLSGAYLVVSIKIWNGPASTLAPHPLYQVLIAGVGRANLRI